MCGAFSVTNALLIVHSIQTAAEANRSEFRQTPYHVGVAPDIMDNKSSPRTILGDNRVQHDDLVVSAADEERMPEGFTRIIENAVTSFSEEVLETMRKAAHLTFDLNAPPEETDTGALEAYNIFRNKDPQTYMASTSEVPSSQLSNKRTAQTLTSLDKVSGSTNPKKWSGIQLKKLRTSAPLKATEVQSSTSRDMMTPTPRTLSENNVQNVHNLYLGHLKRNSAGFKPTKGETREMLGQVNQATNANPMLAKTYTPYVKDLMNLDLNTLKKMGLTFKSILKPSLKTLLKQTSEDLKEIQVCLLRLLCLRRWMYMYRDFFYFCLLHHEICSTFSATSTLQLALQRKEKFAELSVEVAPPFALLGTKKTRNTKEEKSMFKNLMAAVKNANLEEADRKVVNKIFKEVSRDDYQLVSTGRLALTVEASDTRNSRQLYDVLKTPPSSGTSKEILSGRQGEDSRDREKIFELVQQATIRVRKTETRYNEFVVKDNERVLVSQIFDAFKKYSEPEFEPTLEMIKKMWRMFNWKEGSSDPRKFRSAGRSFLDYVCCRDRMEIETALGSERVNFVRATQNTEEGGENYLLELRTEYLMMLLKTYDKFYPFCEKHRSICDFQSSAVHVELSDYV